MVMSSNSLTLHSISPEPDNEAPDVVTASDDYASRFSGPIGKYFLDVQTRITLRLLQNTHTKTVLDVGGGHAQIAVPLVERGFQVTVTGSAGVCKDRLSRRLIPERFKYVTCNFLALPFSDKEFDVVMAFRLLPHVANWKGLISEMCRVAKKAVILDYPDKRSFNFFYDAFFGFKKRLEGNTRTFLLFSRRDIRRELDKNGFGQPILKPEFFFPMVVHRTLRKVSISKAMESIAQCLVLTSMFGSPIIIRSDKLDRE